LDALLAAAKLPARPEIQPDGLIAYQQLLDFMAQARRKTGIWHLPLLAARNAELGSLGTWGRVLARASTLGDLFDRTVKNFHLHTTGARWWTVARGDEVLLCQQFDRRLDLAGSDVVVPLLAHMLNAVRSVVGAAWQPRRITLGYPVSLSLEPLGIDAPVRVTGVTSIAIPRQLLSAPTPRILAHIAEGHRDPMRTLSESSPLDDFEGSVRQALLPLVAHQGIGIEVLAEIARLKVRTLQRRLTESGLCFRTVLQELRFARALERMQDPAAKLIDIGLEVGFSDPAHFTRAFRRWTGLSPREFRRLHYPGCERTPSRRSPTLH
jgi:AraC-like DNA-binding protein